MVASWASRLALLFLLCPALSWGQPGPAAVEPAVPGAPASVPGTSASVPGSAPVPESNLQAMTAVIVSQIRTLVDRQLRENNFVLPAGARLLGGGAGGESRGEERGGVRCNKNAA